MCRICFAGEEEGLGKLISPCLCRGSMRFVHLECLTQWRLSSANPLSFFECDNCKYRYHVSRHWYSLILRSALVLHPIVRK